MNLSPRQAVIASILSYSFCSGSLVLLNKLTLHFLPFPSLVVAFQLLACIVIIYGANVSKVIDVDPFKWDYIKPYMIYVLFFSTGVYCNMRSLNISNVETVIVFRALTPMVVAFLDALFLGREWPSRRSWAGLSLLIIGAYSYASNDEKFQTQGYNAYFWPSLYTIIIALEMAYGKKIVKDVPLKTRSGPVIYTNVISLLPMLLLANVSNEYSKSWEFFWGTLDGKLPALSIILLILGSIVGTAIGYSGWWCRSIVSATSFTLIGVVNKCFTILVNTLIWDQHANAAGILSLFICLAGGMIYQQAPLRNEKSATTVNADDVEFESSIDEENQDEEMETLVQSSVGEKRN